MVKITATKTSHSTCSWQGTGMKLTACKGRQEQVYCSWQVD